MGGTDAEGNRTVLRRDDAWVWDSWMVDDGTLFHRFFLSAPRSLGDPQTGPSVTGPSVTGPSVTGPSVTGPSVTGPWDIGRAKPFVEEPDLFPAPSVPQRDDSRASVGFRNPEPKGIDAFEIVDPTTVALRNGGLARVGGTS